jgi:hypothetical protein
MNFKMFIPFGIFCLIQSCSAAGRVSINNNVRQRKFYLQSMLKQNICNLLTFLEKAFPIFNVITFKVIMTIKVSC